MKNVLELIPTILMVSLVPYFFYSEPNIAQSVIVTAITALVGYKYYLESIKKPDYVKIFKEELLSRDQYHKEITAALRKEVNEIREKQGKLNLIQSREQKINNVKW
jgi:hypothetical protein